MSNTSTYMFVSNTNPLYGNMIRVDDLPNDYQQAKAMILSRWPNADFITTLDETHHWKVSMKPSFEEV